MLCVDRLGSIEITVTLDVSASGTDIRTGQTVDFAGQYTHATPSRGVSGITNPQQRAKVGNCAGSPPAPWVMLGPRTQGDPRNRFQPFKLADWVPNTSPILSADANGGTVPNGAYVTATADYTLPEYIDGIGLQIYKGASYIVQNGRWEDMHYGIQPIAAQTFAWAYNTAPVIASGGMVDGVRANFGDCYVCDITTTVSPMIDGIYDLTAGEIIQFDGLGWQKLAEIDLLNYERNPFWTQWCRNMWDVTANLPAQGGPSGVWLNGDPFANLFLGYAPPTSWANAMSAWLRRFIDREHPEVQFTLLDTNTGMDYVGKVFADSTNNWTGEFYDPSTEVTISATYHFEIT